MPFSDLRELINFYQDRGEVHEVKEEFSPDLEISSLVWALSDRREKLLLFKRVRGYKIPVAANLIFHRNVISMGMDVDEGRLENSFRERLKQTIDPVNVEDAPVMEETDIGHINDVLPILKHYEGDSAPFITTAVVSAKDPESGITARGIHRMELRGRNELGMALLNPPLLDIYKDYAREGKPMPVAAVIGLEPLTFLSSALRVPRGVDKLSVGGALRGEPIEVTKSTLAGIDVPARAEFLLEGILDPQDERQDGPFGEICGYYLTVPKTPTFKVERISSRKSPIYHALLPRSREADLMLTFVAEAMFSPRIKEVFPFVNAFYFVPYTFGSSLVVQVERTSREDIRTLIVHLLSMAMIKKVVVVDQDVNPEDLREVEWAVVTRCQPDKDFIVLDGMKGQAIDPSSPSPLQTSKLGIDATGFERIRGWKRVSFSPKAVSVAESYLKTKLTSN